MAKFKTKGLILKVGTPNPPTTVVAQLGDTTLSLGERDALLDATTHDSSGGTREFLDSGYKTPAGLDGELLYDPSNAVHEVIRAAFEAGTSLYAELTLPDTGAAVFLFQFRVKSLSLPLPVMGKMALNFSFEGLGATTFTA